MDLVEALTAAEARLDQGRPPGPEFWRAVAEVKRDPELVNRYAVRVGEIDRRAFARRSLLIRLPVAAGTSLAVLVTAAGLGTVAVSYYLPAPWNGLLLLLAAGVLLATTHGLGHLVVGRAQGMRFTHWFVVSVKRPQPGVKVDYSAYLRVPARRRAWMHASGAIVTKLVPFILLGPALAMEAPAWTVWILAGLGVLQIVTDVVWSTRLSDWAKFRREMSLAQASGG